MTYFEDQMDAREDGMTDWGDPYAFWADKIGDCEARGHGKIKVQRIQMDDAGKVFKKYKVCQTCHVMLEEVKQ